MQSADGGEARLPLRWPKRETGKTALFFMPSRSVDTRTARNERSQDWTSSNEAMTSGTISLELLKEFGVGFKERTLKHGIRREFKMKDQAAHGGAERPPIFSSPHSPTDTTIYLSQRRVEELDPVDIPVPGEEDIDPKKIEPIGNYGNNENPANVDGADPQSDPDHIDDSQAGDDEDTPHPITPQAR